MLNIILIVMCSYINVYFEATNLLNLELSSCRSKVGCPDSTTLPSSRMKTNAAEYGVDPVGDGEECTVN